MNHKDNGWRAMKAPGAMLLGALVVAFAAPSASASEPGFAADQRERVVLLHGLGRRAPSMAKMERALSSAGYDVCNVAYPSLELPIPELARDAVAPAIERCFPQDRPIHFVAHSLGGIIVRELAATAQLPLIGRVVMLSPPNRGSELADKLNRLRVFDVAGIPAGTQLGTRLHSGGYSPASLGAATFEVGVLTGDRSVNPVLSKLITGPDDGKVAVEEARLEGMRDFRVIHASHTFIMSNAQAIALTVTFLQTGAFASQ